VKANDYNLFFFFSCHGLDPLACFDSKVIRNSGSFSQSFCRTVRIGGGAFQYLYVLKMKYTKIQPYTQCSSSPKWANYNLNDVILRKT
jgi:hypothetical protein